MQVTGNHHLGFFPFGHRKIPGILQVFELLTDHSIYTKKIALYKPVPNTQKPISSSTFIFWHTDNKTAVDIHC